tara:strand:- start:561 stop:1394 length:834 start_codon:yes stop_codon:yes gene_type:complete
MNRLLFLLFLFVSCSSPELKKPAINAVSLEEHLPAVKTISDAVDSTVRIDFGLAIGSGFVIGYKLDLVTRNYYYEILSAGHIFSDGYPYDSVSPVEVTFFIDKKKKRFLGTVEKLDPVLDLAIIKVFDLTGNKPLCKIFEIDSGIEYLDYTTEVSIIGYPQGIGPIVTRGHISGIEMLAWDKESFLTTAQSAPGNSGGPVVDLETGHVIGLLRAVLLNPSGEIMTWCSVVTPASRLLKFLGEYYSNSYPYYIKPIETSRGASFTPEGSFLVFIPSGK